jgi:hypothetical protein
MLVAIFTQLPAKGLKVAQPIEDHFALPCKGVADMVSADRMKLLLLHQPPDHVARDA